MSEDEQCIMRCLARLDGRDFPDKAKSMAEIYGRISVPLPGERFARLLLLINAAVGRKNL